MPLPKRSLESSLSYNISPELECYNVPVAAFLSQSLSDRLVGVVGAAIIIHKDRVLLLQRAADDDCPNLWEVPGGTANDDETIVECVVRELWEEAGLRASAVTNILGEFEWDNSTLVSYCQSERRKWKIFVFLAVAHGSDTECLEITCNPKEHQAFLWVTEKEVRNDSCGDIKLQWVSSNQKKAILEAFRRIQD